MKKITYSSDFKQVIELAKNKGLFLGTGNPNAKILLIGKEAAIDEKLYLEQHKLEFVNNISDWENNIANEIQFSDVDNWFELPKYNPLYPYKGQKNTIESRDNYGNIVRGKKGTSKTWYNYQKIIDCVYSKDVSNNFINFHEYAFSTELNQITGPYSNTIPFEIRKKSIDTRKELFQESFFKGFPIIIVAVGHYVRDFNIDLQEVFQMKFHQGHSNEYSEELKNEYINVHYDDLEKPTKLLIHTNQLSMVSNKLIFKLGEICNDFFKNSSIK